MQTLNLIDALVGELKAIAELVGILAPEHKAVVETKLQQVTGQVADIKAQVKAVVGVATGVAEAGETAAAVKNVVDGAQEVAETAQAAVKEVVDTVAPAVEAPIEESK